MTALARMLERRRPTDWLTILHSPGWAEGIVSLKLMYPVGSFRDTAFLPGTANLTGELLLHGTAARSSEAVAEAVEERGASLHVSVGRDITAVTLQCLVPDADALVDLLLELLTEPAFPPDKLDRERESARMQLLEDEDHALTACARRFEELMYHGHPYGTDPLGTLEALPAIDRRAVEGFFRRELRACPLVAGVAGYADVEGLERRLADRLATAAGSVTAGIPPVVEPPQREVTTRRPVDREWIVLGQYAPAICDDDAIPMRVLNSVLGGSMDCRLFAEIREKRGLAYQVSSSYAARRGPGLFMVYLGTDPANHAQVLDCVRAELARISTEPVGDEERMRAVRYLQGNTVMAMESQLGFLGAHVYYELVGMGMEYVERLSARLEAVTAEDLLRLAHARLRDPVTCVLLPDNAPA